MLNNIKGIKFKGAAFDSETILQLFSQNETDRANAQFSAMKDDVGVGVIGDIEKWLKAIPISQNNEVSV